MDRSDVEGSARLGLGGGSRSGSLFVVEIFDIGMDSFIGNFRVAWNRLEYSGSQWANLEVQGGSVVGFLDGTSRDGSIDARLLLG
jgi:hypothetical protein